MFEKIIAFSIKQKFIIGLFTIGLVLTGIYSMRTLPIDALPDITNNQVQIITTSPNLSTQEVELYITYPIELAVKSIPRIVELRSISRFGVSVITVVFEEKADIYWARTQINERLMQVREEIPDKYGSPELAPISTGLGEIFQYTIDIQEGYEEDHNLMDLRSVQDWIIIPQLLGTKGVAEVNTLGGLLKEYEVAVDPNKLNSMGITMTEIFNALEKNNENTGGAYIDKKPNAYFIRSLGMVNSLEDISKIVIKVNNDIPVLIRDVAKVQFGSAVRYGATTKNGNGEVVNGMVMMLKGENSAEVVRRVKEKIEQIETTLPEGVVIAPYLDRSNLVNRAIKTVRTNLIEGALIVIFILVLLIGNWRAGLIVASVIPLSLLFAVSLMRAFGVSGNLMSLGAIDFGLIVDGAVIIVEAIVHRLQFKSNKKELSKEEMDKEVFTAASEIRTSAAFGEIIILIVYLPILALVGIEGRMFIPMAQTVSFAILGAFILSLTYVPMMSALVLNRKMERKKNVSDAIIQFFQSIYTPILNFAMRFKAIVLTGSLLLFGVALWLFMNLGGEFIPTLEEGDIATHIIIPPGSSLEQEIETTSKAERLVLEHFPEVKQVISKIGSSEVPTDPMPMELADMLVILKDKNEWVTASTKEEMFEKLEEVLNELPGVTTEFSQPVQMRFNELMTGIRSDVGVKIFGEDLEQLVSLGDQTVEILNSVEGIENARAESVSGLPQIVVDYDNDKLALYGLNVSDLNDVIRMGFAGSIAGSVYEGEKKFNLVVRLDDPHRQDIEALKNLYVTLPSGNQVPMELVADIRYEDGPAQISREDGKRRIIIGFNVRGRDVESVVNEIKEKMLEAVDLPVGYYTQFSGQFENLERAQNRLGIAVPLALSLIFVLLFFTFGSFKQAILIFTAIPLSAIGGVLALYLRDMPFSISAGIGFIALFGVSVLNGIVLIGYFNQLKREGVNNVLERIRKGTQVRLRPVIMTAAVASLGFLPMALSTSAGAEVQKPLATVVIGGLVSATLLTLIVLPILYYFSEKKFKMNAHKIAPIVVIGILACSGIQAQNNPIMSIDEAINVAMSESHMLKQYEYHIEQQKSLTEAPYRIPKTNFGTAIGQMDSRLIDYSFSVSQSINPFLIKPSKELASRNFEKSDIELTVQKNELIFNIRNQWDKIEFHHHSIELLESQAELWAQFVKYAERKFELGETGILEQSISNAKHQQLRQNIQKHKAEMEKEIMNLQSLLHSEREVKINSASYSAKSLETLKNAFPIENHPILKLESKGSEVIKAENNVIRSERKPSFNIGYVIKSITGEHEVNGVPTYFGSVPSFQAINAGVSLPLFTKSYNAEMKAKSFEIQSQNEKVENLKVVFGNQMEAIKKELEFQESQLNYYRITGLPNAELIAQNATLAYENGEIAYTEYVRALDTQAEIEQFYYQTIRDYNLTTNKLLFFLNQ